MFTKADFIGFTFIGIVILSLATGIGIQTYRLDSARQQLEQYRIELTAARDRQQDALNTIDECYRNVSRTGEILSESIVTVQDVRRQVTEIREAFTDMENRLLQFYDNNYNTSNNTNYAEELKNDTRLTD